MPTSQEQNNSATPLLHWKQNQGILATSDNQQFSKSQCTTHNRSPVARMNIHLNMPRKSSKPSRVIQWNKEYYYIL